LSFRKVISSSILFLILFQSNSCKSKFDSIVQNSGSKLRIHILPTKIGINILFLRSISSIQYNGELKEDLIKKVSERHARWFDVRLRNILLSNQIAIVPKEKADLILEPTIVDMGEVRAKIFLQGLSVGLVLGFIAGEATGKPDIGIAVLVWEIIEEIIIVYLLKSYFMITTIDLKIRTPDSTIILSKEFTSYSNEEFEERLPDFTRKLRENKVRGSLENNARQILDILSN